MKLLQKNSNKVQVGANDRITDIVINVILVIVAVVCLYPIWFVLIASFSEPGAILKGDVLLWPVGFNFDAYAGLLQREDLWVGYRNTIFYTVAGTLILLAGTLPAAYALSRKALPGRRVINTLLLFTMYFSGGMIPGFLLFNALGWVDTIWVLIVPGGISAYNIIITRSFFESNVPEELYDASRIDGTGYTGFFFRIVLPLSKAIIAILALFAIQMYWNTYMVARIYIYSGELFTLQQIVQNIIGNLDTPLNEMQGGADAEAFLAIMREKQLLKYSVVIVTIAPMIALYPFIQKYLVKGVMVGAVKG